MENILETEAQKMPLFLARVQNLTFIIMRNPCM